MFGWFMIQENKKTFTSNEKRKLVKKIQIKTKYFWQWFGHILGANSNILTTIFEMNEKS